MEKESLAVAGLMGVLAGCLHSKLCRREPAGWAGTELGAALASPWQHVCSVPLELLEVFTMVLQVQSSRYSHLQEEN